MRNTLSLCFRRLRKLQEELSRGIGTKAGLAIRSSWAAKLECTGAYDPATNSTQRTTHGGHGVDSLGSDEHKRCRGAGDVFRSVPLPVLLATNMLLMGSSFSHYELTVSQLPFSTREPLRNAA